jgi:hypothetical protein
MKQHSWNTWFLLSTFWVLLHVLVVMLDDAKQLMDHWFFLFGMILSMINLAFCIYIGTQPSED